MAFRPDRDPNLMLLMNDFGWFSFMMPFMFIFLQAIAVGLAIISDKNARPVFPRYVAYLNFFFALILVPGGLVTYFKSGPFAWDGFVAWWIGGVGFFGWYIVMFIYTLKAIKQQASAA